LSVTRVTTSFYLINHTSIVRRTLLDHIDPDRMEIPSTIWGDGAGTDEGWLPIAGPAKIRLVLPELSRPAQGSEIFKSRCHLEARINGKT
jgi:hypothetical protein